MDFCPYDAFLSSDVPDMVDQQNSWSTYVGGRYVYFMTANTPQHAIRIFLVAEQNKKIKS
jgi:hypothetical protein